MSPYMIRGAQVVAKMLVALYMPRSCKSHKTWGIEKTKRQRGPFRTKRTEHGIVDFLAQEKV